MHSSPGRLGRSARSLLLLLLVLAGPTVGLQADDAFAGVLLLERPIYDRIPGIAPYQVLPGLPSSWDLSRKLPPVMDQGGQQSCATWAAGYAVRSFQERKEMIGAFGIADEEWEYTEEVLFSPAFLYNYLNLSEDCQEPLRIPDVLNVLTLHGITTLAAFPYKSDDCSREPKTSDLQQASLYVAASFRKVNFLQESEIKMVIAAMEEPVIVALRVGDRFVQLGQNEIYAGEAADSEPYLAHAVVVAGYDDGKACAGVEGGGKAMRPGAFKVMNSWGRSWGDAGFGWICYEAFREAIREAYVLFDAPTPRIQSTSTAFAAPKSAIAFWALWESVTQIVEIEVRAEVRGQLRTFPVVQRLLPGDELTLELPGEGPAPLVSGVNARSRTSFEFVAGDDTSGAPFEEVRRERDAGQTVVTYRLLRD